MAFWNRKPATHTNAPRHWPRIELDQFDNPGINLIMIASQLAAIPGARLGLMRDFLYEDGILRVPVVIEEGDQKYCVFAYSGKDPAASAHYSGVRSLLRSREGATAVFYGPEPLAPTRPSTVLAGIDTTFFATPAEAPADGSYALWWSASGSPPLAESDEVQALDRWFEALDGYGFLLFTAFLRDLEMVEEGGGSAYALPDQPLLQPVVGPCDTPMVLCASREEGLFLAFDEATPVARRRHVLKLLADLAEDFRKAVDERGVPARTEEKGHGLTQWRRIRDAGLAKEKAGGADGLKLHAVSVRAGQPQRAPEATTAADRAARPQPPGREEMDFGMDLVDAIVDRLKREGAKGSTQEELGGPNFAPRIVVKVGADVIERRLPYEDAQVAQAAAARALDEWPEAEIVVVLADSAVRESGKRVDVFDMKIENRRERRACSLFQRYRVSAGGVVEPFANPTASPVPPFLLEPTAQRTPVPDEGLKRLARRALDTIVTTVTILDPSGCLDGDPEDTLFSPSALVGRPSHDNPLTVRFMLQGPVTAAMSCVAELQKEAAEWVAFHMDDLLFVNGVPRRRFRICVQRRQDLATAFFDQGYHQPQPGRPFALDGELEFNRWGGPMMVPGN